MSTPPEALSNEAPPPEVPRGGGGTVAAWVVIVAVTLLVASMQVLQPAAEVEEGRLERAMVTFQARYLVGAASVLGERTAGPVERQVEAWQPQLPGQQMRVAVVAGELIGPEAALERLRAVEEAPAGRGQSHFRGEARFPLTNILAAAKVGTVPGERSVPAEVPPARGVLLRLYQDYSDNRLDAPSVDEAERERLQQQLGWLGKLALAPPGSDTALREQVLADARRTFYMVLGGVAVLGVLAVVGFVVLVIFLAFLFANTLPGLKPSPERRGIYAEAFACWLVLFVGLSIAGGVVFGPDAVGATGFLSMLGSLAALGWPGMRGVSREQLRADLGWTGGQGAGVELAAGVGCYAMAIPLVVLAVSLTGVLAGFAGQSLQLNTAPAHPAAEWIAEGTWWQRIQILVLACVAAPIVEEIAFRGLLYRHLRDATRTMRRGGSVLLSAAVSSVLFALLHPQGLLAVPALTAIALALTFMREWRGTLLPSIVAHGLNNALVMAVLLTILAK